MRNPEMQMPEDIAELDQKWFVGNYGTRNLELTKAEGCRVWDSHGVRYLDCIQGIAVNALGHCHPAVVEAIRRQSGQLIHSSNLFASAPQRHLAELLITNTPYEKIFFCNSGTEAIEAAIKFARKYWHAQGRPQRHEIITFEQSFHGRTYGALAATGQPKLQQGFGPMPGGFITVPMGDAAALRKAVTPHTAAILFEPLQAEGGILMHDREILDLLQEFRQKGVLLLADEIQVGLGRTGHLLATMDPVLACDAVTLAKPLGGGLPLGAVLVKQALADAIEKGDHGTTFGGNPVACSAGAAVLEQLLKPGFLADTRHRATLLKEGMQALLGEKGLADPGVRGKGFLLGFPYPGDLNALLVRCRENGLLAHRAGADVLRLMPPLNITQEEIRELLEKLRCSL